MQPKRKKPIASLTPKQAARMAEIRDRWIAIGLSTEPADRPRAEAAIRAMYRQAELAEPRIVWCGSPVSMALTRALLLQSNSMWDSVGVSVLDRVRDSVWDSVGDSVWAVVRGSVGVSVLDRVRDRVQARVWAVVWESVRDSVGACGYGQLDATWLSYFDFFRTVCGLTNETAPLVPLMEQAQAAGWFLPHEHVCWVTERPQRLQRDKRGRLHSLSGPALQYPDGWSIYAIDGERVSADELKAYSHKIHSTHNREEN
jgi:hypothetical protein